MPADSPDDAGEEPARLPWRKNLLTLFGIAYAATTVVYGADVVATAFVAGHVSQAAIVIEVYKILTIGAVALAKDMIR